uniref:oligosaccharide flippase family protein n=1 Tax=Prevotella sp. TaxID=59823 RepID=UPI0040287278
MKSINKIRVTLLNSKLFRDSFWAVFGNGIGNALMLLAGILIARFLGKDLYGEYGVVKTTMFYIASFATFGLGFTSTKYIAQYMNDKKDYVRCIVKDSLVITFSFSILIALTLIVFSAPLANYVNEPGLKIAFQALAVVVVFKAITTTQIGILAGLKDFKISARNSFLSGIFMLVLCVPLTFFGGLKGSLLALLSSQAFNALLNYCTIRKMTKSLTEQKNKGFKKELILFSFPVALQESSFTVCHWTAVMLLTKYASVGELGLYSAGAQWNSIVLMIPSLLSNVVLSYLSGSVNDEIQHDKMVNRMLLINFATTMIPFVGVYVFANFIASFYGSSFVGLPELMRVMVFTTILESCTSVFKSELMAQGKTWLLFTLRFFRDFVFVSIVYYILAIHATNNGAISYAWCSVVVSLGFFLIMWIIYKYNRKR